MNNNNLESSLRKKFPSVRLTSKMGFSLKGGCLTVKIHEKGLKSIMQDNSAAFEGWAVALKHHLSGEIEKVVIDWTPEAAFTPKERLRYNRFLYRLTRFTEAYPWASPAKPMEALPSSLVCNFPHCEASLSSNYKKGSEGWLECKYVEEKKGNFEVMARQLPVGLFRGEVTANTRFTTDGALDIWALQKDVFCIYELKTPTNRSLGIISELMFYANVVNDLLHQEIEYRPTEALEKSKRYREFGKFCELCAKPSGIRQIHAIFLTAKLHPLLTSELIEFINESEKYGKSGIHFSYEPLKL